MYLASSDWHLGDGSERDRVDRAKVQRAVAHACDIGTDRLYLLGDIVERLKFSWSSIVKAHTAWLAGLGHDLRTATIDVTLLPGNHDAWSRAQTVAWLQNDCGWRITAVAPSTRVGQWTLEHGHRFDTIHAIPGLNLVAKGLTWFTANTIGLIWPRMPEHWASPTDWFSPAEHDQRAGAVGELAEAWAEREQAGLIMGHTHRHALRGGATWRYYNCGAAVIDKPYSVVVFDETTASLVTDGGPHVE